MPNFKNHYTVKLNFWSFEIEELINTKLKYYADFTQD